HTKLKDIVFDTADIYYFTQQLVKECPFPAAVRTLSVGCFDLMKIDNWQYDLFGRIHRKKMLNEALDAVNNRFGDYTAILGRMVNTHDLVPDRIAFGKVRDV